MNHKVTFFVSGGSASFMHCACGTKVEAKANTRWVTLKGRLDKACAKTEEGTTPG